MDAIVGLLAYERALASGMEPSRAIRSQHTGHAGLNPGLGTDDSVICAADKTDESLGMPRAPEKFRNADRYHRCVPGAPMRVGFMAGYPGDRMGAGA
jgi:hypothetical protein